MNNILILRKNIDRIDHSKWENAHLIICIKNNGTFEVLLNRNGPNKQIGKCGDLCDLDVFSESEFPNPSNSGA